MIEMPARAKPANRARSLDESVILAMNPDMTTSSYVASRAPGKLGLNSSKTQP